MKITTRQNRVLKSVWPKIVPTNSENGLRRDMRPMPPIEAVIRIKMASLQDCFGSREAGSEAEGEVALLGWVDSVAEGLALRADGLS